MLISSISNLAEKEILIMKNLILIVTFIFFPLSLLSNNLYYAPGQKSELKIQITANELLIEIITLDGYKIDNKANIKFETENKQNVTGTSLSVLYNEEDINPDKYIVKIAVTPKSQGAYFVTGNLVFPLCKDNCILEEYSLNYSFKNNIPSLTLAHLNSPGQVNSHLKHHLLYILLFSIAGGFILNLMPCVLPVLGIKLAALNKESKNQNRKITLISTATGIVGCYLLIGISVAILKSYGMNHGFGLYFQNPDFIIFIIIVLTFSASAILDRIIIPLPTPLLELINSKEIKTKSTIWSGILAGCFATLMSTPCTAPFLSIATAYAIQAESFETITIFFMIGVGLALPYFALLAFPASLNILPKPGKWMMIFKKCLATLTYLAMFWFAYTIAVQLGNFAAIIVIMLALLLKFCIETKINRLIKMILLCSIIACLFILPKKLYVQDFHKDLILSDVWHPFNPHLIEQELNKNKIVVIDITASWCSTCQLNKLLILDTEFFAQLSKNENVFAMRADVSTNFTPEVKKFMNQNNAHAIPFNIVYGPKNKAGIVLNSILTYHNLRKAIETVK